jgi:hypothetical protein
MVGVGIAGVVAYQELTQTETSADPIPVKVVETQTEATAAAEAPAANASEAVDSPAESAAGNAAIPQSKPDAGPAVKKTVDQAKRTAQGNNQAEIENLIGPDDEVVVKGDVIHVGKVRIKNGKVYMPDGTVYETPKNPPAPGVRPQRPPVQLTEEQMRRLTPDQRRKLRALREGMPNSFPRPTPWPDQQ